MWLPYWNVVVTSRNVTFDEEIPRGDVDLSTDEYWLEIRKARVFADARTREKVDDFLYLEGVVFYDDDEGCYFRVTRVTEHTGRYIVAHVMKYNPSITEDEVAAAVVGLIDLVKFHEGQQQIYMSRQWSV